MLFLRGVIVRWGLCISAAVAAGGQSIYYVDASGTHSGDGASWATAFGDLQEALAVARLGDEIRVATGTYWPDAGSNDREASFDIPDGCYVLGGFAGNDADDPDLRDAVAFPTILTGDIGTPGDATDNSIHVVTLQTGCTDVLLDGLIIQDGFADGQGLGDDGGGGILIDGGAPRFRDCTIRNCHGAAAGAVCAQINAPAIFERCCFYDNSTDNAGGAVYAFASDVQFDECWFSGNHAAVFGGGLATLASDVILRDCTFARNSARDGGGAIAFSRGAPRVVRTCFERNAVLSPSSSQAGGGAMRLDRANGVFAQCDFIDNVSSDDAGAIFNIDATTTTLACRFYSNRCSDVGGAIYISGDESVVVVSNSVFSANAAGTQGGAIRVSGGFLDMTNCTLWENRARSRNAGGAIHVYSGGASVANSVLWSNRNIGGTGESAQIYDTDGLSVTLEYCCVEALGGRFSGVGNISESPRFVNAAGPDGIAGTLDDNLACRTSSPCIDAGTNYAVPTDEADLDGDGDYAELLPLDIAGEARFVDRVDVEDVGEGTPPLVDIGAFERQAETNMTGDINCDGSINFGDINPFVVALSGAGAYAAAYPDCDWLRADLNGDGQVSFGDINDFVAVLPEQASPWIGGEGKVWQRLHRSLVRISIGRADFAGSEE